MNVVRCQLAHFHSFLDLHNAQLARHVLREVCGAAQGFVHKVLAHDLRAGRQAFVEIGVV